MAKQNIRERLAKQKKELKERSSGGKYASIKEGTTRARPMNCGEENDWALEVEYIFLSKELGGLVSPSSFGLPCAFKQRYEKWKDSKDEEKRKFAKRIQPKKRFLSPHLFYKDQDGNEPDRVRLLLLTSGQYQELIDLYLDEKEAGDFTDWINGYDIKYERSGKGQFDTEYSLRPCKPTKVPKKFREVYNLEEMIKATLCSYEETKDLLDKFFSAGGDDDKEDDNKSSKKSSSKKKKSRDL